MTPWINMVVKCLTRTTARFINLRKMIGSRSNLTLSLSIGFGNEISSNRGTLLVKFNSLRSSWRGRGMTRIGVSSSIVAGYRLVIDVCPVLTINIVSSSGSVTLKVIGASKLSRTEWFTPTGCKGRTVTAIDTPETFYTAVCTGAWNMTIFPAPSLLSALETADSQTGDSVTSLIRALCWSSQMGHSTCLNFHHQKKFQTKC